MRTLGTEAVQLVARVSVNTSGAWRSVHLEKMQFCTTTNPIEIDQLTGLESHWTPVVKPVAELLTDLV